MRRILTPVWHSLPGTVLLHGAFLAHFVSALVALYRRATLRMSLWEAAQLLLGLAVIAHHHPRDRHARLARGV